MTDQIDQPAEPAGNNEITIVRKLPSWAVAVTRRGEQFIQIDPDVAYPAMLEKLALDPDQYGAEVARRCAINHLRDTVGVGINVHVVRREKWSLEKLPQGTKGKDAQALGSLEGPEHYKRIKGLLG